ncbi:hypothetical protein ACHAXS_001429 [Conticribra weissflogii]
MQCGNELFESSQQALIETIVDDVGTTCSFKIKHFSMAETSFKMMQPAPRLAPDDTLSKQGVPLSRNLNYKLRLHSVPPRVNISHCQVILGRPFKSSN